MKIWNGKYWGRCSFCGRPIRKGEEFEELGKEHTDLLHVHCARELDQITNEVSDEKQKKG